MSSTTINNPYSKKTKKNVTVSSSQPAVEAATVPGPSNDVVVPSSSLVIAPGVSASALVISASDKAGMEGIDRARIDAIILRESGNSLFMQQQRRRDQKVDERIEQLKEQVALQDKNHPNWKRQLERELDEKQVPTIISRRRKRSCCVVVDMDMFYMACELLSRPELNDKPVCVGGNMITTSNYVARRYGVRSAMAGWIGDKLVEELSGGKERLIHVPLNFDLYKAKSLQVRSVLSEYDPNLRAYSLDEAFLDLAPYLFYKLSKGWDHEQIRTILSNEQSSQEETEQDSLAITDSDGHKEAQSSAIYEDLLQYSESSCREAMEEVLRTMRARVTEVTNGLTCSAGAAPNFMLAKIASDRNKPNGQLIVGSNHDDVLSFLHPLPPRKVGGIGRVTDKILNAFSITTVAELHEQRALVQILFKSVSATNLLHASIGCSASDENAADDDEGSSSQKGISRERTFQAGKSWSEVITRLEDIGRLLSSDMKEKGFWARNMCVKVKLHTFDCLSRSKTMPTGVFLQDGDAMVNHAVEILHEIRKNFKSQTFSVRLIGIRCSGIVTEEEMKASSNGASIESFFEKSSPRQANASAAFPLGETSVIVNPTSKKPRQVGPSQSSLKEFLSNETMRQSTGSTDDTILEKPSHVSSVAAGDVVVAQDEQYVKCPICQREFRASANQALNVHMDSCLNSGEVRKIVREESQVAPLKPKPKRQCLETFFARR